MNTRRAFRDVTNSKASDGNAVLGAKKNVNAGHVSKQQMVIQRDDQPSKIARTQQQMRQQAPPQASTTNAMVNEVSLGVQSLSMPPQQQSFLRQQPSFSVPNSRPDTDFTSYQFRGNVDDIDTRDKNDPLCVTDYVQEMYDHFREQEVLKRVDPTYMSKQPHINEKMRGILVDWLTEVHLKFKLVPETLYLCINLIDRFLSRREVNRSKLQLLGVTCLLVASKYEEIYPPELRDLVYICDSAYAKEEILDMEEVVLKTLKYKITIPSAHSFLVRFLKAAHADKRMVQLSCYILDSTLQSHYLLRYLPSQLAAASVFIARRTVGRNPWSPTLLKYAQYYEEDILPVARDVLREKNATGDQHAVNKKYASSRYGGVTNVPLEVDF
eukprot:CAMPEP_0116017114 /NCGR_PEP_ID=MMETSP0321-20121206/7863_1 /TAXON_ID=163516 /ORGANISM="Leptocylindrus danicus var. danicus, Strain B650" /LENGTH=382 /DNA_ID=CAMNT_0003487261 /DNA_START=630 /DNA_END=1778 /DNA_ORIENTATION=-